MLGPWRGVCPGPGTSLTPGRGLAAPCEGRYAGPGESLAPCEGGYVGPGGSLAPCEGGYPGPGGSLAPARGCPAAGEEAGPIEVGSNPWGDLVLLSRGILGLKGSLFWSQGRPWPPVWFFPVPLPS